MICHFTQQQRSIEIENIKSKQAIQAREKKQIMCTWSQHQVKRQKQ
jgi:hypothetical protein